MSWLKEIIGTEKAVIAMCHLQPLPGDPGFSKEKGMDWVVDRAYKDLTALWDGSASIDIAVATGAKFVREIFTGVYASDFGLWNTNYGEVARHRCRVGGEDVKLLFNIVPEAAKYLGERDIVQIAKSTVFNCKADALCVSGLTAGVETDQQILKEVKDAVKDTVVLANTGCRIDNIEKQLAVADGAVVGTTFKYDGVFENGVDKERVLRFMDKVHSCRKS